MKKKLLIITIVVCVLSMILALCACDKKEDVSTDDSDTTDNIADNGLVYELSKDGVSCMVVGYQGNGGDITIPTKYKDRYVVGIDDYALANQTSITNVHLPYTVSYLGDYCFANCTNLTTVNLQCSVMTAIYPFWGDTNLKIIADYIEMDDHNPLTKIDEYSECEVEITDKIISSTTTPFDYILYDDNAYIVSYREYMETITIPSQVDGHNVISCNVRSIGQRAQNIVLPDTIEFLGTRSLYGMFDTITLPSSIKKINEAFLLGYVNNIVIDNNALYEMQDNCLVEKSTKTLIRATTNNSKIPDGIERIGHMACYNYANASVVIPDSVTSIGKGGFYGSYDLTDIKISKNVKVIEPYTFRHCSIENITIPNTIEHIKAYAFSSIYNLQSITFEKGSNLKTIGDYAFGRADGVKSIVIPKSVEKIGENPFFGFANLTSISVEEGNTHYHAENNCLIETASNTLIAGCRSSIIPDYITTIGNSTFRLIGDVDTLTIPENVTHIDKYAFDQCRIHNLYYKGSSTKWEKITKGKYWNNSSNITLVHCSDKDVPLEQIN